MRPLYTITCEVISVLILALFSGYKLEAQIIPRPEIRKGQAFCFVNPINRPPLATFSIRASTRGGNFPNGTEFILRLSNKSGEFNENTIVIAETLSAEDRIDFIDFSYPFQDGEGTNIGSATYRTRIEIKDGSIPEGGRSEEFSVFYYDGTRFNITPGALCQFGVLTAEELPNVLTPDTPPTRVEKYIWFRKVGTGDFEVIPGEESNTIFADVAGTYFYTTDLGSCMGFIPEARSNQVEVFEARITAVPAFTISASGPINFCASESVVLQSTVTDPMFFYQWVRDDQELRGENSPSITVTGIEAQGDYRLRITDISERLSACATPSDNSIFISLKNPLINFPSSQELIVSDIPGQDEVLTVEVTGEEPRTIVWMKDDVDIPDSNRLSIVASGPGKYTARVSGSSCTINQDITDNEIEVIAINNININIDYDNPSYFDCELGQVGLTINSVTTIFNGIERPIDVTVFESNIRWLYSPNFDLVNNTIVSDFVDPSIVLENSGSNGSYQAEIALGSNVFLSNIRDVKLNASGLFIEIGSSTQLSDDNNTIELSVTLPEDAIDSLYRFRWLEIISLGQEKEIPTLEGISFTDNPVLINTPGQYTVEVTVDGCPEERLESIDISSVSNVIPNVITPNESNNRNWVLPREFTDQSDISVTIYTANGEVDFSVPSNYTGQWPRESGSNGVGTIYYYIISRNNSPVEKGAITLIR